VVYSALMVESKVQWHKEVNYAVTCQAIEDWNEGLGLVMDVVKSLDESIFRRLRMEGCLIVIFVVSEKWPVLHDARIPK
jgi:hypothetical protein